MAWWKSSSPKAEPGHPGLADEQDSAIVRTTFRFVVQRGVVLGIGMSALHSTMFALHGDPSWMLSLAAGLALLPLHGMVSNKHSYPVFLTGLIIMMTVLIGAVSLLSIRYGRYSGFHLLLVAVAPATMVSGRISIPVKWLVVTLLGWLLFILDSAQEPTARLRDLPEGFIDQLRISNLAAMLIMVASLMQHYFLVIVRTQRKLMEFAALDPLTGLFNRRHFLATAAQEVAKSERYGGSICVALADLDHFKSVNDRLGHDIGDAVLRHASEVIRNAARTTDCVCRWGGEEFLVLLPQTDLEGAMHIAERICMQVAESPLSLTEQPLRVTLTLGVAMLNPGEAFDNAVRRADGALYAGKAAGRNRAVLAPS